jgi:hypothetical protein
MQSFPHLIAKNLSMITTHTLLIISLTLRKDTMKVSTLHIYIFTINYITVYNRIVRLVLVINPFVKSSRII